MVTKITLTNGAVQHLETLEEYLPDASSYEDVIDAISWHFAREHGDLKVALDGTIEHTDTEDQATEVEA